MKKTLAVLFMLVFLFSLGGITAHAQGAVQKSSYAYIPLLSPSSDATVPVSFRARETFNRMAPGLARAQAQGKIVRFEPEFRHGLLKVEYQSGFDLASALKVQGGETLPIYDNGRSVLEYTRPARSLAAQLPQTGVSPISIWVGVYDSCFEGWYPESNGFYGAYLYDNLGRLVASRHSNLDSYGTLNDCFDEGIWYDAVPGYSFSIDIYDPSATTLLDTFSDVVPRIDITGITLKSKTLKGIGPANDDIGFEVYHPELNAGNTVTYNWIDGSTSSKGAWTLKLSPSIALRGGDEVDVDWPDDVSPSSVYFYRYLYVPYLDCELDLNWCSLYGIPGKTAQITLTHAKKNYKISGKFDPHEGWFGGDFHATNSDPVFMFYGDKVTGSGAPTLILPYITANPSLTFSLISGSAPASRWFEVDADVFLHQWYHLSKWVNSDTSGIYTADFSGDLLFPGAYTIYSSVWYVDPLTGNETDFYDFFNSR